MEKKNKKLPIIIGAVAVALIAVIVVLVIVNKGHRVIEVKTFNGAVILERGSSEKDIVKGMHLKSEDTVTTGEDGLVELLVDTDKHIVAEANTCFTITSSGNEKKGKLKIELLYGTSLIEIENKLPNGSSVEVETPNASLSVRGTTFETTYTEKNNTTVLKVTDGVVSVATDEETAEVEAGKMAIVTDDEIKVMDVAFPYNENIAFEVKSLYLQEEIVIGVKELEGWICDISQFQKDGINISYRFTSAKDIDYLVEFHKSYYGESSVAFLVNQDGDTIIAFDSTESSVGWHEHEYIKKLSDEVYFTIVAYDTDGGQSMGDATIETFLPLTMNCYYVYPDDLILDTAMDIGTETDTTEEVPDEDIVETVPAGTPVAEDEWSSLLRGELEYTQLEYLLRVAQMCYQEGNEEYVTTALWDLWFVPSWDGVYEPINGTNDTYDVETLNNLLSFLTDEKISESNINSYCSLSGNEITYKPCDVTRGDSTSITIVKAEYGENNEIIVEYNFKELYGSDGMMGRNGVGIAHLVPDANGKYKLDYIEEYSSEEFNYN